MRQKVLGHSDENLRRDNRRGVAEVSFSIDDEDHRVEDLGMGGFRLAEAAGRFSPMQEITVDQVVSDGHRVSFGARAEVVWAAPGHGGIGCRFLGLTPKQFDIMEALVMHRPLIRKSKKKKQRTGLMSLFGE